MSTDSSQQLLYKEEKNFVTVTLHATNGTREVTTNHHAFRLNGVETQLH